MLIGRRQTLRSLSDLLDGTGAAAVLTGLPGAGKTAVLDAVRAARGRALHTTGVVSDSRLPYAVLAGLVTDERLLADIVDDPPHPLRLRLDVLSWLEAEAEAGPLVIVLDDAQWADDTSLSVLGFLARRLSGTGVSFLAACRDGEVPPALAGLPTVALAPLDEQDAARLLEQAGVRLPGTALPRLLDRAAGNPLALLELGRAAAADAEPTSVELAFADRLRVLPDGTRQALLLAAAGDGDLRTVGRVLAPEVLLERLAPAEAAGLVVIAGRTVRFQHPLARSAAYQLGTAQDRVRAHRQLADAYRDDPDRRVWHLAEATVVTDETVAAALAEVADRAERRGAYAEAVRLLIRSAELSPDRDDRERRVLRASWMAAGGGAFEWIIQLAGPLSHTARTATTRAVAAHLVAYAISQTNRQRDAWRAVLDALRVLLDEDPGWGWNSLTTLAVLAYRRGADESVVRQWMERYDAITERHTEAVAAARAWIRVGADPLSRPLDVLDLVRTAPTPDGAPTWVASVEMMLGAAAWLLDDSRTALTRLGRAIALMRQGGPANMTNVLMALAQVQLDVGDFDAAEQTGRVMVDLAGTVRHAFAGEHGHGVGARVAAVRGQIALARTMEKKAQLTAETTEFRVPTVTDLVTSAYLAFAERDAQRAWEALRPLFGPDGEPFHPHMSYRELGFYVVTGVRAGVGDQLRPVVALAGERLAGAGPRLRLQLARARAQLAGDDAEPLHLAATTDPAAAEWPFELACAQLEYGAWLRRRQRSRDARAALSSASAAFVRMGALPWADFAATELRAAGVTAPGVVPSAWSSLTGQEREVVRLAATGMTNREIGASLFLSARTVSTHLYKAYPKLGVTSRAQLRDLVPPDR
ncbi:MULTISPECIES: LuxR family transcriptional regulator [Actinoplanes]|uniref:helix-turn-helix transcriptional regulator n=1 Tax=Actinoplanes TaxID=1865 RepID=UPI0005F2FD1A|nr:MULTISPECIES: LuxR family transcriptional regulator [Actinoplanes]GLY02279.1 transcriptional regulator [Actinoplanes sp. NBRC 101535]